MTNHGVKTIALAYIALGLTMCVGAVAAENGVKQPVFLLCPHMTKSDAWSLYLVVDENDHSKVLSAGIEELTGQNSADSSYADVLAAQIDPKTKHTFIAALEAKDFGSKELVIKEDNALHVTLSPQPGGSYEMMLSMRTGLVSRFVIGGKE